MEETFFFYDLETTGFNRFNDKVMQFAGQRYSALLEPIGEPINLLIKTPIDCLPSADAIILTGITPQQTQVDGLTEVEFLEYFYEYVALPGTIFIGFNSVRFDDEFMRALAYRNFYDPYEWQYSEGKSRADVLDIVRMTRALRPDGMHWPVSEEGKPTNRLTELTAANDLEHAHAHDAMSDVSATAAVARMIRGASPKLFDYLVNMRKKSNVQTFLGANKQFIYTSGRYDPQYLNTTIATQVSVIESGRCFVYDLRHDPDMYRSMSDDELLRILEERHEPYPVKPLKLGACPAIAPLSTLDDASRTRLALDLEAINAHQKKLDADPGLVQRLVTVLQKRVFTPAPTEFPKSAVETAESALYESFLPNQDKSNLQAFRSAAKTGGELFKFKDKRLNDLILPYLARNYPKNMNQEHMLQWQEYTKQTLFGGPSSRASRYMQDIVTRQASVTDSSQQYVLSELALWVESIYPPEMQFE